MDGHPSLSRAGGIALVVVPLAFLAYFFLYPLLTVLVTGFTSDGRLDLGPIQTVLGRSALLNVAWFTLWQAVASTLLTVLLALPAANVMARYEFPGKSFVRAAIVVPFVLPTVVVGSAFLALLGPDGPLGIDLRQTIWAILIAHVFFNYSIVVRTVSAYWERIDPALGEAAQMLGAGRMSVFLRVTLPMLRPAIASAASLVFLFTFTSFGIILILGGLSHATIEVEIWRQATGLINFEVAAALAFLQIVGISVTLFLYSRYQERKTVQFGHRRSARPIGQMSRGQRWHVLGNLLVMLLLLGTPLFVLIDRSLRGGSGYSFDAYSGLGEQVAGLAAPATTAIWNSARFALVATVLAVAIGLAAATVIAYRRGWLARSFDALLMLPLGTSAVTLGFGFLLALDAPLDLRTSIWIIPIAHAMVAIPFVVRTAVPVMRSVRHRLREAAAMLGAPPERVWQEIDLPLVARAGLIGAGFAFAVSLGEFGATSFLALPSNPTLPTAIFRLLGRPGTESFTNAMALSTLLMIGTTVTILLIERLRRDGLGDF
ncbi:MAG: iron ABC transporter permease [Acidimicrobiia bacterium]|nr:iron ABC transporter permease [Acidimicrobiia bacterium]